MYPYYALFDERRRESDENRFWFWNSMHFPIPHPAFDVICIDSPYQAVGSWQNRVFAVPPAMGIDYRVVNGYVYISGNPVTDPDKIAERAGYFQKRAGHYFANWAELYDKWKDKMRALIAELDALQVPGLPEYEHDEVAFAADRNTAFYEVLDAYGRCLRLGDLMWQNHFEFLLLGYGAYATFAELCKEHLPDIPDQHIAQMVAGIDVLLFRPDAELRRLAGVAIEKGVGGAIGHGRGRQVNEAGLSGTPDATGWRSWRRSDRVQHGHRRRPPITTAAGSTSEHPLRLDHRPQRAGARRPCAPRRRQARPAEAGVRAVARGDPRPLERPAEPSRTVFHASRSTSSSVLVFHPLVEQGARVRRAPADGG
jgi:pyruvate,water dikinase